MPEQRFLGPPVSVTTTLRAPPTGCRCRVHCGSPSAESTSSASQSNASSQCGEVAQAEVVGEGGIDALGGVDVATSEPVAECLRREVNDLGLIGGAAFWIRDCLALRTPVISWTTSLRDSMCWMLRVEMTSMPASRSS